MFSSCSNGLHFEVMTSHNHAHTRMFILGGPGHWLKFCNIAGIFTEKYGGGELVIGIAEVIAMSFSSQFSSAAIAARDSVQNPPEGYYGKYSPTFPNPVYCFVEMFYAYKHTFYQKYVSKYDFY